MVGSDEKKAAGRTIGFARRPLATAASFSRNVRARINPLLPRPQPLAWTTAMTVLAAAGAYLTFLAHFFDRSAIRYMRDARGGPDFRPMDALASITDIGKTYWYLVPAATFFVAIALLDWSRPNRRAVARLALVAGQSAFVFVGVALAEIFNNIVKIFFGRARPKLFDSLGPEYFSPFSIGHSYASFPSGHATTMGVVAMVLLIWFPRLRIPAVLLCALVACSRVASFSHYPSDVVAGFSCGLLLALYLARWLALRGVVFRLDGSRLIPRVRFGGSFRRRMPSV